jgi:hypothetical protein
MRIYMDVHIVPGVNARDAAQAHQKDMLMQEDHACKCMTYWVDEERENVFCLIEAPDKEAVVAMHNRAHGLIPNKIIEVNQELVEAFLGRIYDPVNVATADDGLKVFNDPSFRIILFTSTKDPAFSFIYFIADSGLIFIERFVIHLPWLLNLSLVKEHAKKGGFPANSIVEVSSIISPATANGNSGSGTLAINGNYLYLGDCYFEPSVLHTGFSSS